jgi:ACT domain
VATCILRVGMPDRPGALGAVASRIGAVHADVVGIEILTRADGRAMDEIVVEIDSELIPLLLSEIVEVDGVAVVDVRTLRSGVKDRKLEAYRTASALIDAATPDELLAILAERISEELDATWTTVLDTEAQLILASTGAHPGTSWLLAALKDSDRPSMASAHPSANLGPDRELEESEVIWANLDRFDAALCAGRPGWPFSDHDRKKMASIAHIADARWSEVATGKPRAAKANG